jgi:predicted RNA-binding Zn ribbon-like protein
VSWYVEVDGLVLPRQVAGHPALELVNTRAGWGDTYDPRRQDYLRSLDHLVHLARLNGLVDEHTAARLSRRARRERHRADAEVDRARRLRADLHDLLLGSAGRAATARVTTALSRARQRQRLELTGSGARWSFPGEPTLADPLDAFLVAAGELLVDRPRIGACPGTGCGWLFVDTSGRRRWCQMAVCGNRAKQAAHARRTRTPGTS